MWSFWAALLLPSLALSAQQQPVGSIRGVVWDRDFEVPLPGVQVVAVEISRAVSTTDQGNFLMSDVPSGTYTLVFSKEGYVRQVEAGVEVVAGRLTEVDVSLAGEFTEMEEFVVQDILEIGAGSEAALLKLRFDSPALMDSVSAELISRAGASDAASALPLVAGATVEDGKFAVIRGLPDRYVSSQMNGVRLPTADEDKRAVELDQFPAAVIESIQVSKTFTPDQQGDASGGAVNLRLRSIPDANTLQVKNQVSYNTQAADADNFLTYDGGGVSFWGNDDGGREIQPLGENWEGAVGVSEGDPPLDLKWSTAAGGKHGFDNGVRIGGFASFFYERDSAFYDDGVDDSYWVTTPGQDPTPRYSQGAPSQDNFKTALFDVTQSIESVQWGGLGTIGIETDNHALGLTYLYTNTAEDKATLAEDTRGKEYFFPGHDPDDPTTPGHGPSREAAPYLRLETLEYTERTTGTLQLNGRHFLPFAEAGAFKAPELDWVVSTSTADLDQPDKRLFGSYWTPGVDDILSPTHNPYKPGAANFNFGNLQRIFKDIEEESDQYALNLKFPFEQWTQDEGYLKVGLFDDSVDRKFNQDTFSNFKDNSTFEGDFGDFWSDNFPSEDHPITESLEDVDYDGEQEISAFYGMADIPLFSSLNLVGGARFESTDIGITNDAEEEATWYPPGATAPTFLNPGEADVNFSQDDVLPSIGLVYVPIEDVTLRGSYSETVARQTFKELSPIIQQEYSGGPIFIGNPDLEMSALKNYDVRLDYTPYEGGLFSASWFYKDIEDPIEYVQRVTTSFDYTTPVNYPKGRLSGFEFEVRQGMGVLWDKLQGFSVGANATLIDSKVVLPPDEADDFDLPEIQAPMSSRDATNAPEYLYNLYLTYDLPTTGTQAGIFYTVKGDTLVAGAGISPPNLVPSVYAEDYGTLNATLSQRFGRYVTLQLQAKNLTNPVIEEVYRSEYFSPDVTKTSYTAGTEFAISLNISF